MDDDNKRVVVACPKCGHQIVSAPEDDLPKGQLICPGCGVFVQAPGKSDLLVEEAKDKIKDVVEDLVGPANKKRGDE